VNEHDIARILGSGWAEILAGTMLAGPLVVWMLYRLAFPPSGKAARQAGTEMVPIPSEALWLCSRCTSLNLPGARRCYHCLTVRPANQPADVAMVVAADVVEPSRVPWVPVMAPVTPLPVTSLPVASLPVASVPVMSGPVTSVPVMSGPIASMPVTSRPVPVTGVGPLSSLPVASSAPVFEPEPEFRPEPEPVHRAARRPVGVMAKRRRVPVALAMGAEPAAVGLSSDSTGPASDSTGPASDAKPLCPLLRGIGDARIVFMLPQPMPHPDYRCQAGQRPAAIDSGHQAAYCLSAAYRSCERYLALAHRVSGTGVPDAREPDAPARSQLSG
jgi:hypothetical protein